MSRADVFAGLLLAAGFGACLWEASSFQYGTEFAPGPGFAPVWLSAIGIAISLLIALNAFKAKRRRERSTDEASDALDKVGLHRVGATLAGFAAMLAIAPWLGLVPSIFVFLLFLTLYVQRLSVLTGIAASAGTVFFVYLVFVRLLDVPIPSGPLGF
jgi:putative tricarboxylic transport membrane protein